MDGINHLYIGEFFHNATYATEDTMHGLTQIFTTVCSQKNQTVAFFQPFQFGVAVAFLHGSCHCVDNGIAGNVNLFQRNVFLQQIFLADIGGCEEHISHTVYHLTIHFFREGAILIVGTQTCFHVTNGYLVVKRSQRACKGSCGVTVYQHNIRLRFLNYVFHTLQHRRSNAGQSLTGLHDIQIVIGGNFKGFQHLVQHLTMLRSYANDGFDFASAFQFLYQGCHFDCFGTSAEDAHYLNHRFYLLSYMRGFCFHYYNIV